MNYLLRFKKILIKIILISVGIFFSLMVSILFDRVSGIYLTSIGYFKAISPDVTEIYDTKEFKLTTTISSQGIRNEELTIPKPKNTYRILALGDSFTFGWGVELEKTWTKLLQKSLSSDSERVEVINTGVPGTDLYDKVKICQSYKDRFQADMVIISLYSTTDLYRLLAKQGNTHPLAAVIKKFWPTLSIVSTPNLGNWHQDAKNGDKIIVSNIWAREAGRIISQNPKVLSKLDPKLLREFGLGRLNPALLEFATIDPQYWVALLDENVFISSQHLLSDILKQLKNECIGDSPAILSFLPSSDLVSKDYFPTRLAMGFEMDPKSLELDLDTPLSKIADSLGYYYLSPLESFRKDGCKDCYFPYDTHLTEEGHKRVADYLLPKIQKILNK